MGAGLLTWYYAHAVFRPNPRRDSGRNASGASSQADVPLPPLTRPAAALPTAAFSAAAVAPALDGGGAVAGVAGPALAAAGSEGRTVAMAAGPLPTSSSRSGIARRLSGPVYAPAPVIGGAVSVEATPAVAASPGMAGERTLDRPQDQPTSTLSALLHSEPEAAVEATVLATRRLLLPKGAFIDCTLETAIDSTLPGMTTCVTATDTFGEDGKVVLLERGTKLVGETRGQVQQGSARVFVIWTQARTPTGVVVPLDSPGTDELGRSGLAGTVDRHFWDRFGAAILVSTIDGAVQAAVESGTHDGGTTIINPSSVQDVSTETLKSTLNIPPTVIKHNGDRIQILVARDIDFRSVYQLRSLADAR